MGTVPSPGHLPHLSPRLRSPPAEAEETTTAFHITGFSRFRNVPINPTELVVRGLPKRLAGAPLAPAAQLASARVLTVSAHSARDELHSMYAALPARRPGHRTVFVHLGVNVSLSHFELEVQARNEATFSCPDEAGWTPIKRPIDRSDQDISATRRTTLSLEPIRRRLLEKGFKSGLSSDAGRFVCNWVYYNSLQMATRNDVAALFVHVPPASVMPVDRQTEFLVALLETIAEMP